MHAAVIQKNDDLQLLKRKENITKVCCATLLREW